VSPVEFAQQILDTQDKLQRTVLERDALDQRMEHAFKVFQQIHSLLTRSHGMRHEQYDVLIKKLFELQCVFRPVQNVNTLTTRNSP
jgi:uncharacterized membrane protein YccC